MPLKVNYAKKPDSLAFRIQDDLTLRFEERPAEAEAEIMLDRRRREEAREGSWVDDWLTEILKDGPVNTKEIWSLINENQISRRTIFRAKKRLGIISRTHGYGNQKITTWELLNKSV